jgi:hypothetical protein
MNKLSDQKKTYRFTFCEVSSNEEDGTAPQNAIGIDLSYGEVRNIQTLVEYSIPLLLGWHCIYNPSVVGSNAPSI